jgi:hypothetical protein
MKRIKVIATLFIVFSASLMNYHDQPVSSVNYFRGTEMISCTEKSQEKEIMPCSKSEAENPVTDQQESSGKNYEATMVIM